MSLSYSLVSAKTGKHICRWITFVFYLSCLVPSAQCTLLAFLNYFAKGSESREAATIPCAAWKFKFTFWYKEMCHISTGRRLFSPRHTHTQGRSMCVCVCVCSVHHKNTAGASQLFFKKVFNSAAWLFCNPIRINSWVPSFCKCTTYANGWQ